jgi:hypothetical protein
MNIGSLFEAQVVRDARSGQLSRVLCIKAEKFESKSLAAWAGPLDTRAVADR